MRDHRDRPSDSPPPNTFSSDHNSPYKSRDSRNRHPPRDDYQRKRVRSGSGGGGGGYRRGGGGPPSRRPRYNKNNRYNSRDRRPPRHRSPRRPNYQASGWKKRRYDDRHPDNRHDSRDHQSSSSSRRSDRSGSNGSSGDDDEGHFQGQPNDTITERYTIVEEMGKGTFGKVFKCKDSKHQDIVAVKVVRAVPRYIKSAEIEARICDDIFEKMKKTSSTTKSLCVKMFSHFHFRDHYVMVHEPLGMSLYDIIKKNDYRRLPLDMVQSISKQLLQAIAFLQSINMIHTDLKLENVLFVHTTLESRTVHHKDRSFEVMVPKNSRVKLIDFGGATYDDDPDKSTIINTRQYRGPEVTLELGWSFPSDIWSAACIIAEHEELEHLALIEKLCGKYPTHMVEQSKVSRKYFDKNGFIKRDELSEDSKKFINECLSFNEFFTLSEEDQYSGIRELLEHLLIIDPVQRWDANTALQRSTFLQDSSSYTTAAVTSTSTRSSST